MKPDCWHRQSSPKQSSCLLPSRSELHQLHAPLSGQYPDLSSLHACPKECLHTWYFYCRFSISWFISVLFALRDFFLIFFHIYSTCLVCVCIPVRMCVHVCVEAQVLHQVLFLRSCPPCVWGSDSKTWGSPTVGLPSQWSSNIFLSPLPPCWDYKHVSLSRAFSTGAGDHAQIFTVSPQSPYQLSCHPSLSFVFYTHPASVVNQKWSDWRTMGQRRPSKLRSPN